MICHDVYAGTNIPLGQSESRPDPEAGPKGILMPANKHIKRGLVLKLLMRVFSWRPCNPGTHRYPQVGFNFISVQVWAILLEYSDQLPGFE